MKIFRYLLMAIGISFFCACSDSEESIPCTEIVNLTSVPKEGQIELKWEYPEGDNTIRYIEISYFDIAKQKDMKKSVSVHSNNFVVENTLQKHGEYHFKLQPLSTTFTRGNVYEINATSLKAPATYNFTSIEFALTEDDIYVEGLHSSTQLTSLIDGNLNTFINTDYTKPAGTVFWIDFNLHKTQEFLKFSYINRNEATANFPAEIECYVKANANDEWTLIETLTQSEDKLPTGVLETYTSPYIKSPFPFNFFRFRVPKTHTGKPNFSLAEMAIYNVRYTINDPEA